MKRNWRIWVRGLLIVLGIVLVVEGIATGKFGAAVIGICCLGAVANQELFAKKGQIDGTQDSHS
jgi:hypothetical protein